MGKYSAKNNTNFTDKVLNFCEILETIVKSTTSQLVCSNIDFPASDFANLEIQKLNISIQKREALKFIKLWAKPIEKIFLQNRRTANAVQFIFFYLTKEKTLHNTTRTSRNQ